jgi:hypothetical protein
MKKKQKFSFNFKYYLQIICYNYKKEKQGQWLTPPMFILPLTYSTNVPFLSGLFLNLLRILQFSNDE